MPRKLSDLNLLPNTMLPLKSIPEYNYERLSENEYQELIRKLFDRIKQDTVIKEELRKLLSHS